MFLVPWKPQTPHCDPPMLTTGVNRDPNSPINHPLALLYSCATFMRLPNNVLLFAYLARFVLATQFFKMKQDL